MHSKDHKDQNYDAYKDGNIIFGPQSTTYCIYFSAILKRKSWSIPPLPTLFLEFTHHMVSTGNSLLSAKLGDMGTADKGFRG